MLTNPGASGASLRNADGEVIGILSYTYHPGHAPIAAGGSNYLSQVFEHLDAGLVPDHVASAFKGLAQEVDSPHRLDRRAGGTGLGTPILQEEILEALVSGPVAPTGQGGNFYAHMTAFPDHEMRSAEVIAAGLEAYPAARNLDPATAVTYDWNPLGFELDAIISDPVVMASAEMEESF